VYEVVRQHKLISETGPPNSGSVNLDARIIL
jgi:hypothetical protein